MSALRNEDALDKRARDLAALDLNGLEQVLVSLLPAGAPTQARLELLFHNDRHVADLLAQIAADPSQAGVFFAVHGGRRVPAGRGQGQVQVRAVAAGATADRLLLTLEPIGDYSTYRLELVQPPDRIDPLFAEIPFKFRPGCFGTDCAPEWAKAPMPRAVPAIDYLAKDYDSFRHTLIAAMMQRVPGWEPSSEADLDQVLIDLFAAAADELSDYQDRVMNEAYLASARKRVSLARHARLMDYHVHQGQQASTWLALEVATGAAPFTLAEELQVWTGTRDLAADAQVFATRQTVPQAEDKALLDPLLNALRLHTWSGARPALSAGSTSADVVADLPGAGQPQAQRLCDLIRAGTLKTLLVQEHLNPLTGRRPGRDPRKRQLLRLRTGDDAAQVLHDPVENVWLVRLHWQAPDALRADYCFTSACPDGPVERVSLFHGNLLRVHHGRWTATRFHEPGSPLPSDTALSKHRHYRRLQRYGENVAVCCDLPDAPLAYLPAPRGGEVPARSTLQVHVAEPGGGSDAWDERIDLVHTDNSAEEGDAFVVETDERRRSTLRLGNGINGRWLPQDAVVDCRYQIGGGVAGNVGCDTLVNLRPLAIPHDADLVSAWNPFDVVDGCDPEPVENILRAAPEAYLARQLRAITLSDYVRRAEEVPGVSRAAARYAWTGSWRTVRICIDPAGTTTLEPALREAVAAHLESVRLIGEDLELRPPRYIPLRIRVRLCVAPEVWPEDLRAVLEQEFSDAWTPDGRPGFFHPDAWSFGDALHRSQIEGRLQAVAGVEHVLSIDMERFDRVTPGVPDAEVLETAFDEVIEVRNDPDARERGFIDFELSGGRR